MLVLCRAFSYSNIQATPANLQAPSLQSEPFNLGEASRERERERERGGTMVKHTCFPIVEAGKDFGHLSFKSSGPSKPLRAGPWWAQGVLNSFSQRLGYPVMLKPAPYSGLQRKADSNSTFWLRSW